MLNSPPQPADTIHTYALCTYIHACIRTHVRSSVRKDKQTDRQTDRQTDMRAHVCTHTWYEMHDMT